MSIRKELRKLLPPKILEYYYLFKVRPRGFKRQVLYSIGRDIETCAKRFNINFPHPSLEDREKFGARGLVSFKKIEGDMQDLLFLNRMVS